MIQLNPTAQAKSAMSPTEGPSSRSESSAGAEALPDWLDEIDEDAIEAAAFFMDCVNRKAYVQALCDALAQRGKETTVGTVLREMGPVAALFRGRERAVWNYVEGWRKKHLKK